MSNMSGDFYEDDEPVERIQAAFDRGTKILTAPRAEANYFGVISTGPTQTFGARPVAVQVRPSTPVSLSSASVAIR